MGCTEEVLACATMQCRERWEVTISEAKVVLLGLLNLCRIIVESDCSMVIQALRNGSKGSNMFSFVIVDILEFCSFYLFILFLDLLLNVVGTNLLIIH